MKSFQATQKKFTQSIRTPDAAKPKSDDEARRLGIYQSLFFNNIMTFLQSGFPVIFELLDENQGTALARHFFQEHACRSPYFAQISQEFVEYLSAQPACISQYPPWMPELAHYEWLELDVSIRKTTVPVNYWELETFPETLAVSPLASMVSYSYPVHLIGPDFTNPQASEDRYFYVVYRDRTDDVAFMVLNPLTAMLVNQIEQAEEPVSETNLIADLCNCVPSIPAEQVQSGVVQTVSAMLKSGILISGD